MSAKRRKNSVRGAASERSGLSASRASHELEELNRIGIALSETRDVDQLLRMILNGKGYPYGLNSAEIPVQAKMMTICDIFDALSATDRAYKKAVPTDKALDILKLCVREEEVDAELFRLFLEAQVYRVAVKD